MQIREARPEDVDATVPLLYSSGPPAFDYVFSHNTRAKAKEFLAATFVTGRGAFSYPNHWVLEDAGEVVAAAAGYTSATAKRFLIPDVMHILRVYGFSGSLGVMRRGLQMERIIVHPKGPETFYLCQLGVAPSRRGQGLGQRLIEYLQEEGRKRGAKVAALDVSVENSRAEALYTRMGYKVTREMHSELRNATGYVPSHRRMELDL